MNIKRRSPLLISLLAVLALIIVVLVFIFRSQPTWYLEASIANTWARFIRQNDFPLKRVKIWNPADGIPKGPGLYITHSNPGAADTPAQQSANYLTRYENLQKKWDRGDAVLLAVNPWMVFYKHSGTPLRWSRAAAPGAGNLLLSGAERSALRAWASQLVQREPGNFPAEQKIWDDMAQSLATDPRFQQSADTCVWAEALNLVFREGDYWIYAPLSRIMALPSYRIGLLNARVFPIPPDWHEFGLQAELLWAIPTGSKWQRKKLAVAESWLKESKTQTLIANEFGWIPAHPDGSPYNTLSRDAQLAYLSSSFVWQQKD